MGEEEFGKSGSGAHQLATIEFKKEVAIVFVEGELRAVWSASLGEIFEWDHFVVERVRRARSGFSRDF